MKEAARRVLAGETLYAIAKDFNSRGVPPRRPSFKAHRSHLGWTPPAIKQMLNTPAYAAKRTHKGKVVADAQWPPLIDPDVWETKLLPLLNNPRRKRTNDWPARHLLTGIAVCDECGAIVRTSKQNKGSQQYDENGEKLPREKYYSYMCQGVPGRTGFHTAIKEESLDLIVTELLIARLERPDFLAMLGQADGTVDAERQALIDEINDHETYLDEVREIAAARHDIGILVDQEARINPKIAEAQRKLQRLAVADPKVVELASSGDVRGAWERLEFADKRRVIRAIMRPRIKRAAKRGTRGLEHDRIIPGWV